MRVMVMVKAGKDYEAGAMPGQKLIAEMGKFNQELIKAGVLLAADGLHPSPKGKRVRISGQPRTGMDGPFSESKKLSGGHWLRHVKTMEAAVEWLNRAPLDQGA